MSKHIVTRLAFSVALMALALAGALPAFAACFYPLAITTTYYAWIDNSDPSWYSCQQPIISPCCAYLHWGPIGGSSRDCDGNYYEWGDTTTCTGPDNTVRDLERCPPICE